MQIVPFNPESSDQPPSLFSAYGSTIKRAPKAAPVRIPQTLTEVTGPDRGFDAVIGPAMADLTRQHPGEPIGQRIIVSGRVLDEDARPVAHTVVEVWQANAAGRYIHAADQWNAPLDPNFTGVGRVVTDVDGRYKFITVKPGAYPWRNHKNAWRPPHIHFSLFGPAFATRLVTQMYFPDDPLNAIDPVAGAVPTEARLRMVSRFDIDTTREAFALGYIFDLVLRGRSAASFEGRL
jgi:protocatechuate 3,4-dioxygenase, beta subunit